MREIYLFVCFLVSGYFLTAQSTDFSTPDDCFYELTENYSKCAKELIVIGNISIVERGTYYDTILVASACDTIKKIIVTELPMEEIAKTITSPPDSTVIFEGKELSIGSITPFVFKNRAGCDSIVYVVVVAEQEPMIDNEVLENKEICLPIDSTTAAVCLPFPIEALDKYELSLTTGAPISFHNCDFREIYSYQYNLLPYIDSNDSYKIEQWKIGSSTHVGAVASMEELIEWIQEADPKGKWKVDPFNFSIAGGRLTTSYGEIILTKRSDGLTTYLGLNVTNIPMGTLVEIDMKGKEEEVLTVRDISNDCTHKIVIKYCP